MEATTSNDASIINSGMTGNLTGDILTFMEEVEAHMTFKVAIYINYYWFLVLAPIGLVGNTLSFLVMIKPSNRKVSTCIYMAAISINDNLLMCLALHNWLLTEEKIFEWHIVQCKTVSFLTAMVMQNSRYQVLAMTVDKYVAIKWPHRAVTYSTPRRVNVIIIGVFICTMIYNVRHIPMSGLVGGKCRGYVVGGIISVVLTWISFFVNGVIPFSLLIYLNYVIVQTIKNSGKMFGSITRLQKISNTNRGMETRQNKMRSAEKQLTIMLLLVTMLYLALQIPLYIRTIYVKFVSQSTPSKYANSLLILMLTYALSITSSGINFFLYCISGKKFPNDLMEMLCCNRTTSVKKQGITVKSDFYSFAVTKYTEFNHPI